MIKVLFILLAMPLNNNNWKSDTIYWCSTRKLNWKDFKATNPFGYGALSVNQILFRTKVINDSIYVIEIYPVFICNKSWSNDTTSISLLTHEQLHFEIAELTARRIRKFLSKRLITEANYHEISREVQEMAKFQSETNKRFDSETGHGFLKEQQIRWRKFIDSQLKVMEKFSSKCPP